MSSLEDIISTNIRGLAEGDPECSHVLHGMMTRMKLHPHILNAIRQYSEHYQKKSLWAFFGFLRAWVYRKSHRTWTILFFYRQACFDRLLPDYLPYKRNFINAVIEQEASVLSRRQTEKVMLLLVQYGTRDLQHGSFRGPIRKLFQYVWITALLKLVAESPPEEFSYYRRSAAILLRAMRNLPLDLLERGMVDCRKLHKNPLLQRHGVPDEWVVNPKLLARGVDVLALPELTALYDSRVPPLQHLSRCVIRDTLYRKQALPNGVGLLPLPKPLLSYLRLDN